ncbi:MAG TPA: hypothetical protein G4O12_08880 [Dehalococcoidia bacterium]|nr:hypothetical protein [Dehalococcoidia bacterium]
MKRIVVATMIVTLAIVLVVPTACVRRAEFEVTALNISPTEVAKGEPTTVTADVENIGVSGGTYIATLTIDGVEAETKEVTLTAGAKERVVFWVTKDTPGTYYVELGGLSGTLRVRELKPAEFKVVDLSVPEGVLPGQAATITVRVTNTGEVEGNFTAGLVVNGIEVATETVAVAPGVTETMSFTLTKEAPGTYTLQIGGVTGTLKVLKPAEFKVVSLDIAPNPVKMGAEARITISIENVGEAEGTYTASLLVDGLVEQTSDVTLAGGATTSVSFLLSKDSPGSYSIEIGDRDEILKVVEPVRLDTGTYLVKELKGGKGRLEIKNELDSDTVVVLSSPEEPEIALLAVYVQSHDSYEAKGIKRGTYFVYVALGEDWDEGSRKFLSEATYYRKAGEFEWKETARTYETWHFVFGLEYTPGQPISEDEFPSLG